MANKAWREKNKEKLQKYRRDWYHRNKRHAITKIGERSDSLREWLNEYKSHLKCEKCLMDNPACLIFHHINPREKELDIAKVIRYGWCKERILKEIKKCQVLCSNCHMILHFGVVR